MNIINQEIFRELESSWASKVWDIISKVAWESHIIISLISEMELLGILKYTYKDQNNIKNSEIEIADLSYLDEFNFSLHQKTILQKQVVETERQERGYIEYNDYNSNTLKSLIYDTISSYEGIDDIDDIDIWLIDKNKFTWDISIKIFSLLKKYSKWGIYIKEKIPEIIDILNSSDLVKSWTIKSIYAQWIYINIELSDQYLFNSLSQVLELKEKYGESDVHKWESIVVDYSSPNTAKHLHAWHIRSTIIGHVLSNLYSATWYYTHRVNHINDWWWFGQLIEWYNRWKDILPKFEVENDMLFHIYSTYRKGEKYSQSLEEFDNISRKDKDELEKYYGPISNFKDLQKNFLNFIDASKNKFSKLEKWEKKEVELWKKIVDWSMKDFQKFYDNLWIHHQYTIWESFYSNMWRNIVKKWLTEWKVVFYDQKLAEKDIKKLQISLSSKEIKEKEFESKKEEILNDIWCYLVPLANFERFVVLKSDESTIYSTRDIAAIEYRNKVFTPNKIVYEVGQEQAEHFDKLFKSAKKSWIKNIDFSHIYHGFYIDADSKKKLSSRDGASNVQNLINWTIDYFKEKYKYDNKWLSQKEIEEVSRKLGIWSIIFNDIKKDKKTSVLMNKDIRKTCQIFEESGWAYIAYSSCRAKSILNKSNREVTSIDNFQIQDLQEKEKTIINEINKYPSIVLKASNKDDPSILTTYLYQLARYYNSYYKSSPVLQEWFEYRLVITKSIYQVLKNGMKLCHIEIPEKI